MRVELSVYRYFGFPPEVRQAFWDWALTEGLNLADLGVRAVRLGEGVIECERYVDLPRTDRLEWHTYPVKTVPPLEMFTGESFIDRLIRAARLDGRDDA